MNDYPKINSEDFDDYSELWNLIDKWDAAPGGAQASDAAKLVDSHIQDLMRAYVNADRAMRGKGEAVQEAWQRGFTIYGWSSVGSLVALSEVAGLLPAPNGYLQNEYDEATVLEQLQRMALDAARYRWLREQHWSYNTLAVVSHPKSSVEIGSTCPSEEHLDARIDAAMKA